MTSTNPLGCRSIGAVDHTEKLTRAMAEEVEWVTVRLWRADAIVLFDWLQETDLNSVPITHKAQKQALADLATAFEARCDSVIEGSTTAEIEAAQTALSRDMNW